MITKIRLYLRYVSIIVSDKNITWSKLQSTIFRLYVDYKTQGSHIICCHVLPWHWRFTNVPFRLIVAPTPWWPEWTMYHNAFVLSSLLLFDRIMRDANYMICREDFNCTYKNIDMNALLFFISFYYYYCGLHPIPKSNCGSSPQRPFLEKEMSFGEGNKNAIMGTREPLSNPFRLLWFRLGDGKVSLLLCICRVKPLIFIEMFYLGWWSYKKYFCQIVLLPSKKPRLSSDLYVEASNIALSSHEWRVWKQYFWLFVG